MYVVELTRNFCLRFTFSFSIRSFFLFFFFVSFLSFTSFFLYFHSQITTPNSPYPSSLVPTDRNLRHNRWNVLSVPEQQQQPPSQQQEEQQNNRAKCSNSKQGKTMIVDDRGSVCTRKLVEKETGCCSQNLNPNPCQGCHPFYSTSESVRLVEKTGSGIEVFELTDSEENSASKDAVFWCCDQFEVCVGCCLQSTETNSLVDLEMTKFQQCMAMCRTNSCSTVHQKVYLLPNTKYCLEILQRFLQSIMRDTGKENTNTAANLVHEPHTTTTTTNKIPFFFNVEKKER